MTLEIIGNMISQLEQYLEHPDEDPSCIEPVHVKGSESVLTFTGRAPSKTEAWIGDEIKLGTISPDLAKLWLDSNSDASSKGYFTQLGNIFLLDCAFLGFIPMALPVSRPPSAGQCHGNTGLNGRSSIQSECVNVELSVLLALSPGRCRNR